MGTRDGDGDGDEDGDEGQNPKRGWGACPHPHGDPLLSLPFSLVDSLLKENEERKESLQYYVTSISFWENHIPEASYWSGRVQVLIMPSFHGDLLNVGLVTYYPQIIWSCTHNDMMGFMNYKLKFDQTIILCKIFLKNFIN